MSITSSTPSRTHCAMVALLAGDGGAAGQRRGVYLHSCMQSGNLTYGVGVQRAERRGGFAAEFRFKCLGAESHLGPQA
jgi:hypothetical protein